MSDQKQLKWDLRFLQLATLVATWSKDSSAGVGAVIVDKRRVVSTGYNGFPRGLDDKPPERHERPVKYWITKHAEENAIINAARIGVATEGLTMYVHGRTCCAQCAGAIDNAGIVRVVMDTDKPSSRKAADWEEQHKWAMQIFDEAGIAVVTLSPEWLKAQADGVALGNTLAQIFSGVDPAVPGTEKMYQGKYVVPGIGEIWADMYGRREVVEIVTGCTYSSVMWKRPGLTDATAIRIWLPNWDRWTRQATMIREAL